MTKLAIASLFSVLASATAFAQGVAAPEPSQSPADPETLVGQHRPESVRVSGWFLAPTFGTTSVAGNLAYLPGLRGGIYLNRRVAIGLTVNGLGSRDSTFSDSEVRNVGAYGGVLLQYVVESNRLVHFTIESTLGSGRWCARIADNQPNDACEGKRFEVFEPAANLEINLARHLRLATGVGYRFAVAESGAGVSSGDLSGMVARSSLVFGSF